MKKLAFCICENNRADQLFGYLTAVSGDCTAVRSTPLLAHLSRRLIGELIVYKGIRRPSVRHPSVCQHFQTTSPLKP